MTSYLKMWTTPLEKYSVFSWMTLEKNPEWQDVQKTVEYLKTKNVDINDTFLFNQITTMKTILTSELQSSDFKHKIASEKWVIIFSKLEMEFAEQYLDLYRMCEYIFSIPGHNANVERIFSFMEIQWSDERNKLSTNTVESILQCLQNYNFTCSKMHDYLINNKALLKAAKSSEKYNSEK